MKITFKDVGQGDTIILEWADENGKEKIGIVDCKVKGKDNPVIDYLKTTAYEEIDFLILSHPHADHYSGYLELLNYLEEKNIPILRMGHTVGFNGAEAYWKYFVVDTAERELFESIVAKWFSLRAAKDIRRIDFLHDGKVLDIDNVLTITCLSPAHDDIQLYQEKVHLDAANNEQEASQSANILSTILKVSFNNHHFLLTSDAEKSNFQGVLDRDAKHIKQKRFHICQMPHHGSFKNLNNDFWKVVEIVDPQHAIASAGNGYKHPSLKVLEHFHSAGYKVHCTNIVNGMVDFVKMLDDKAKALDSFSILADEYTSSKDRVFKLVDDIVLLVE
jgi:beta-lactamase superfamily II metal-dependent hydrolase